MGLDLRAARVYSCGSSHDSGRVFTVAQREGKRTCKTVRKLWRPEFRVPFRLRVVVVPYLPVSFRAYIRVMS